MKIALIHDGIICRGGAERVFLCFIKAFPNADIFTSVYYPENTFPEFKKYDINTTWYQKIAKDEFSYRRYFFPFGVWAAKSIDLRNYDVVLQSTTTGAKYAKYGKKTKVISYCHQPFRLLWNPNSYSQYKDSKGIKKKLFDILIKYYKKIDFKTADRVDIFIANSKLTEKAIIKHYNRKPHFIINPPVGNKKDNEDSLLSDKGDFFLLVSRFEPYKKVDLAIEAFNSLGYKLVVVGKGTQKEKLLKLANSNIIFKEGVSDEELSILYSRCKAFIFPQLEDYGITPLEANSYGKPVIAYGKGGVLETMLPFNGDNESSSTAIFFKKQEVNCLTNAVLEFEKVIFNKNFIFEHSKKFNEESFINNIQQIVLGK